MKTSNKILISAFLLSLLVLTAIQVALYAKYKRGDFTSIEFLNKYQVIVSNPSSQIHNISIKKMLSVDLVPADTLKFKKESGEPFYYEVKGDTMFIRPDASGKLPISGSHVVLYVPSAMHIISQNCNINIEGVRDSAAVVSQTFDLDNTTLNVGLEHDIPTGNYFSQLSVHAKQGSVVTIRPGLLVRQLEATLSSSALDGSMAAFGNLSISADYSSRLHMSAGDLKKSNLTISQQ